MSSFVADLAHGEDGEQRLLNHFKWLFPDCEWVKGKKNSKHLDLICIHCGDSVEVKSDRKAAETGNICFEWNLFKFSKAKRVCYLIGTRAYCWELPQLKDRLLELHCNGKTRGMLAGDGWKNPLVLAPIALITESAEAYELNEGGAE